MRSSICCTAFSHAVSKSLRDLAYLASKTATRPLRESYTTTSLRPSPCSDVYKRQVRDGKDVQLDNVARTVICNNVADCHIALHWDSDGLSYDKGCFYASVPKQLKNRKPVASYWKEHDALGKALIKGLRSKKVKISGTGAAEIDLTQTSYSTIPSVDIELGNQCSDHSDKKREKLADGLLRGMNSYAKKYIHVAPLSSLGDLYEIKNGGSIWKHGIMKWPALMEIMQI